MIPVKKDLARTEKTAALLGFTSQSLVIILALVIVLLVAIVSAIYFYLQYRQTQDQLIKSAQSNEQAALISEVGKLIVLPSGEQPTIATVSDETRLKGQPFFVHARNGDKVLIYTKEQEAILYDPVANKLVEVGPISLTQVSPTPTGPTPTPVPVKVAVYNGTSDVGLATTVAQELKQKLPWVSVVIRSDAQSNYSTTLVADLTGRDVQASTIAKTLGGEVAALPKGEKKPTNADIVVILGK